MQGKVKTAIYINMVGHIATSHHRKKKSHPTTSVEIEVSLSLA